MVTWNVATSEPPDDIGSLLHLDSIQDSDLYVIGWVLWFSSLASYVLHIKGIKAEFNVPLIVPYCDRLVQHRVISEAGSNASRIELYLK